MNRYILYVKPGCPYCRKVLSFAESSHIPLTLKEKALPGVLEDLLARGGKSQFPYLVDTKANVEMYESDDIIEYLKKQKH
jgi:glutaredoxin 3